MHYICPFRIHSSSGPHHYPPHYYIKGHPKRPPGPLVRYIRARVVFFLLKEHTSASAHKKNGVATPNISGTIFKHPE